MQQRDIWAYFNYLVLSINKSINIAMGVQVYVNFMQCNVRRVDIHYDIVILHLQQYTIMQFLSYSRANLYHNNLCSDEAFHGWH